jgi:hypothetical protein
MKRYRLSYRDGVIEDTGQVFPVDASRQLILAEDHDTHVMELRNATADLISAAWDAYQVLKKHSNFPEARVLRDAIETLTVRLRTK